MSTVATNDGPSGAAQGEPDRVATRPSAVTPELIQQLLSTVAVNGSSPRVTTRAPFDGGVIAELPQANEQDVLAAKQTAKAAQARWASTPLHERCEIFLRLHDLVLDNQELLMDLIQLENGKARRDAYLEVADIAITCRYYARTAHQALRSRARTGLIPGLTMVREVLHPKGVVSVISPWNYPLSLAAGDSIPALIAGNAVVQKPDNQTALTALYARQLAVEAGLAPELWQMVLGRGSTIGTPLLDIADYVMFTGSTASGRRIAAQCGERLIGCSAELGGKNAMIVMEDADLSRAVEGATRACFSSSGQLCISMERMYVADGIWDRFVPRFVEAVEAMAMGPAFDFSTQMGSLTSAEQLEVTSRHVEDARSHGATVLTGGNARADLGPFFFEPTVLTGVDDSMECFASETFGPLVSLYRYTSLDEAIDWANDTRYGLNASVWTRNGRLGRDVAARLHSGTVNVNEAYAAAWGSVDSPMGGMGDSGIGRRHGEGGITKYTEPQTIAQQKLMNLAPIPSLMDDQTFAKVMTTSLRALKALRWR